MQQDAAGPRAVSPASLSRPEPSFSPVPAGSVFGMEDRRLLESASLGGMLRDRRWDSTRQMRQRSCPDALLDFEIDLDRDSAMDEPFEDFEIMVAAMERAPHTMREGIVGENRFSPTLHPLLHCRTTSGVSFLQS